MQKASFEIKKEYKRTLREGKILAEAMVESPVFFALPSAEAFYRQEREALFEWAESSLAKEGGARGRTVRLSATLRAADAEDGLVFLRTLTVKEGARILYLRTRRDRIDEGGLVLPAERPQKQSGRRKKSRKTKAM